MQREVVLQLGLVVVGEVEGPELLAPAVEAEADVAELGFEGREGEEPLPEVVPLSWSSLLTRTPGELGSGLGPGE